MRITRRKLGIITAGVAVASTCPKIGAMDMPGNVERVKEDSPASPRVLGPHDGHLALLGGTGARIHDRGGRCRQAVRPCRTSDAAARPGSAHAPASSRRRVQFRPRGQHRGAARRFRGDRQPGRPDLQATPAMAHVLERRGHAGPILELISPAGFENYFRELGAELVSGPPDPQRLAALCASYALDVDMSSVPSLIQRFGVRFPGRRSRGRIELRFL